ncbi:Plexin repeat family protein [Histomonas meleagridis]|uniref:Plexin repeat family protein n=1 Tax=Histomonas meleagridis TaxID=135588 RepID=UPI0035596306|nr:Plexin repeat family protein [Histomonas meleagridis]KAH0796946.1 Plexin repeat family protein [Histomonas meleagridis]
MLFQLVAIAFASDCDLLYTADGCQLCVSHYADRQCGWCRSSKKCITLAGNETCPTGDLYYGPDQDCSREPLPTPVPTLPPTPKPIPIMDGCDKYTTCDECTVHQEDRSCGWCRTSNKCMSSSVIITGECNVSDFYFENNAKCGAPIPPTPLPWPRLESDTDYCVALSNSWCLKCVSSNTSKSCGWCGSTKECVQGDAFGPLFGSCDSWSFTEDQKCTGIISKGGIIAVRVVVGIVVAAILVVGVIICLRALRKLKEAKVEYDTIPDQ